MIWEASDENCKNIEVAGEKIVEISNGWHIDNVVYSDRTSGKDMKFLIIEIRRDTKETCEGCRYTEDKYGYDHCRKCSRNWIDRYEKSEDE